MIVQLSMAFIGLTKAFDLVAHPVLLNKLNSYGICDKAYEWFVSYLSGRSLQVKVGNSISDPKPLSGSVPQGSILSSTLFIMYLNGANQCMQKRRLICYAGDIVLYISSKCESIWDFLQTDLNALNSYLLDIGSKINTIKTKLLTFREQYQNKKDFQVKMNSETLEKVTCFKYLGIWIDSDLDFKSHLSKVCKKLSSKIRLLSRQKKYFSHNCFKMFADSLISSVSHYCLIIWGHLSNTDISKLDNLYYSVVKNIFPYLREKSKNDYKTCIEKLNWMTVSEYRDLFSLQFLFKNLRCIEITKNMYKDKFVQKLSTRETRSECDYTIPSYRSTLSRKSFSYTATKLCNSLPLDKKMRPSTSCSPHQ